MILPDDIIISLKDQYLDLKGLSVYSNLSVSTLRDYIHRGTLPGYKVKGKILILRSEFDGWMNGFRINRKRDINRMVDGVMEDLKSNKSE